MAPFITNDLNPTPLKTGGDDLFKPAVMRGAGVVIQAAHQWKPITIVYVRLSQTNRDVHAATPFNFHISSIKALQKPDRTATFFFRRLAKTKYDI